MMYFAPLIIEFSVRAALLNIQSAIELQVIKAEVERLYREQEIKNLNAQFEIEMLAAQRRHEARAD